MSNKKSIGFFLVILGFILIALTGIRTISNPEIFTHIALGQAGGANTDPLSYTLAGEQWVNMNPLYNKLVAALWMGGSGAGLITLVHVSAVLAAFILMLRFGKNWGGPISQGLSLLLCAWLLFPVFNPGPTAFFLLFTALFLTLLYRLKNFPLLAGLLLILQVLWTNMHPSFLFGPVLILFFAIEDRKEAQTHARVSIITPRSKSLFILSGAALLVTVINPNLINLHRHVLSNWKVLTGTEGMEWISLFSSGFSPAFFNNLLRLALLLGAAGLITLRKKLPIMITMLAIVGAFLTVRPIGSIGNLLSFALLTFPFLILSFSAIGDYLTRTLTTSFMAREASLGRILSIITLVLMIITAGAIVTTGAYVNMGSASRFGLSVQEDAFPLAATGILDRDDFPEKIINISHDGGYLAVQNPTRKIFCDTRTSLYGLDFHKTLDEALRGQAGAWKMIQSEWNPHAVVLNGTWLNSGALANRLIASRAWKMVYFDGTTIILIRDLPEYATLINDPSIQKYGVRILETARQEYIAGNRGLFKTGNSSRLIGAAGFYLALNRPTEAEAIYSLLVKNSPNMASAWLGLGQTMILKKQLTKGIGYMEQAADITPRNARVWIRLLNAYRMKGDEANVRKAVNQLNKFFQSENATIEEKEAANQKKEPAKEKPNGQPENGLGLPEELK